MQAPLVSRFFKEKEALHCLLLSMGDMVWLVPSVMGAEVLSVEGLIQSESILQTYEWRGQQIPLLSASLLLKRPKVGIPTRIIVLHSVQAETETPFWGLLLDSLPQIIRLSHRDLAVLPEEGMPPYMQAQLHLANMEGTIYLPNFSALESALSEMSVYP